MKCVVFSDIHFHPFPAFARIEADGLNSRLKLTCDRARDIVRIAREERVNGILFAGDLFHTKKIDAETIDAAVRAFSDCEIPIVGVPGNHDMATFGGEARHSARALGKRFRWLDDHEGRVAEFSGERPFTVYGIPYVPTTSAFLAELERVPKKTDILLTHVGFAGAFMGSDYIADMGDCVDYAAVQGKADLVISGHFHQPQLITFDEKGDFENRRPTADGQRGPIRTGRSILVPGSPEQHNFGDMGSPRGCWVVDTNEQMATFRRLNSPEFVEVKEEKEMALARGNYVRVMAGSDPAVAQAVRADAAGCVVEAHADAPAQVARAFSASAGDAPAEVVRKYVEHSGSKLSHERLMKEAQRFLA